MATTARLIILSILVLLAGCETNPVSIEHLSKAAAELSKVRTFEGECTGPCKFSFTDPRDRAQLKMPTNGYDATIAITGQLTNMVSGAVMPAAMGYMAIEGFKAMRGHGQTTTTNTTTASGAGASTGGTGHYEQVGPDSNNQANTTTTTTTTDSHDATATPTVVNQPAPVVVRPEVITVPTPVVP